MACSLTRSLSALPVGFSMNWDLSTIWDSFFSYLDEFWKITKEAAVDGLSSALGLIPVPPFIDQMGAFFAALPPDVIYYTEPFHFGVGLQMVLAAWVSGQAVRFVVAVLS